MIRRLLLVILLLAAGSQAWAQAWSGGVRYQIGGDLTANATIEWPSFDLLGLRAGPAISVQGAYGPEGLRAVVVGGLTATFVRGTESLISAWAVDLRYRLIWESGVGASYGPEIGVYMTGRFP